MFSAQNLLGNAGIIVRSTGSTRILDGSSSIDQGSILVTNDNNGSIKWLQPGQNLPNGSVLTWNNGLPAWGSGGSSLPGSGSGDDKKMLRFNGNTDAWELTNGVMTDGNALVVGQAWPTGLSGSRVIAAPHIGSGTAIMNKLQVNSIHGNPSNCGANSMIGLIYGSDPCILPDFAPGNHTLLEVVSGSNNQQRFAVQDDGSIRMNPLGPAPQQGYVLTALNNVGDVEWQPTSSSGSRWDITGTTLHPLDATNQNVAIGANSILPSDRLRVDGGNLSLSNGNFRLLSGSASFASPNAPGAVNMFSIMAGSTTNPRQFRVLGDGRVIIRPTNSLANTSATPPQAGYVLTSSDNQGTLDWQPAPTGATLPTGALNQTLRHDGNNWVADSLLSNNGTQIGINTTTIQFGSSLHVTGPSLLNGLLNAPGDVHMAYYPGVYRVGIGNANPTAKLDISDTLRFRGNSSNPPALGYVLTASDSQGNATWQPSASGLPGGQPDQTLRRDSSSNNTWVADGLLRNNGSEVTVGSVFTGGQPTNVFHAGGRTSGGTMVLNNNGLKVDNQGKTTIGGPLVIPTGAVANRVLTSDASGNATWQPSGLPTGTTNQTLRHNGSEWIASNAILNTGSVVSVPYILQSSTLSGSQTIIGSSGSPNTSEPKLQVGGNVGIRKNAPPTGSNIALDINGQIRIQDGSQGLNKVLTSTADGTAVWAAQSSPVPNCSADQVLYRQGNSWVCKATSTVRYLNPACQQGTGTNANQFGALSASTQCASVKKCDNGTTYASCSSGLTSSGCALSGGTNPTTPQVCNNISPSTEMKLILN
jgi:hypothetical protein